jgi:hypothetical protein
MLVRLSYVSRALIDPHAIEMLDIVRVSLINNARAGVTGVLYFDEMQFFQALEGDATAVDATFARILEDRRHQDVALLTHDPITERRFGFSLSFRDGCRSAGWRGLFDYDRMRAASADEIAARLDALRNPAPPQSDEAALLHGGLHEAGEQRVRREGL